MAFATITETLRSSPILTTFVIAVLPLVVLASRLFQISQRQLPPGPRGWPIVGYLLSLGRYPHITLQKLSQKYGPVMLVRLGSVPTLIVSSPSMAKEVLKTHDLVMASRPAPLTSAKIFTYDASDLVWCPYGAQWRNLRKICTLKLLTTNRIKHFQSVRQEEVLAAIHAVLDQGKKGNLVNVSQQALGISLNSITQMMIGKRFYSTGTGGPNDSGVEAEEVVKMFEDMGNLIGLFNVSDFVSFLKPLDLQRIEKKTRIVQKKIDDYFQALLDECARSQKDPALASGAERLKGTFLEQLLVISAGPGDDVPENCLSPKTIKALLLDIYAAAGDTPAKALEWSFAELLRNPKLLKRAQEELERVVGSNRLVDESDIPELNFVQAVVKESLRLHTIVPFLVPRQSTATCSIAGYHIPAKTQVLVNIWALHTHPDFWERPLEFDPDRFLNSSIDVMGQDFEFLPFGSGRRICPGWSLGLLMVQYPLAQLLHCFTWELPDGQSPEDVDMSGTSGLIHCKSSPMIAKARPRLPDHVYGDGST